MDIVERANEVEQDSKKPEYWPDGVSRIYVEASFMGEVITKFQLSHLACYLNEVRAGERDPDMKRTSFGFNKYMFDGYLSL